MAQKNLKNLDNKLYDNTNNVLSKYKSALFLSPIEFENKQPNKEKILIQNLENQSLKTEDEHEADQISQKKDNNTPRSIDTNLKKCLGQDLLKHLDGSPMRQQKIPLNSRNQFGGQNKNSYFYKKIGRSEENEISMIDKRNDENAIPLNDFYKLCIIPDCTAEFLKKRFNDDFFVGMPLRTEEAYFSFVKNLYYYGDFGSQEDCNSYYYQSNSEFNKLQYLKAAIFEKVLGRKEDYFSFYSASRNKAKSFYYIRDHNKILSTSQNEHSDNFYTGNYKEKTEEELINLNNSDEFKNEFFAQNKNFNNFNYTQPSQNESSACKIINSLRKDKNAFNSHFVDENENEENIYSSIFSNNKIKKSNSTNYLGDFTKHKISFDPELFSSDNNNLERIFHSPNFYNFNSCSHSKEKNIFEQENNTLNSVDDVVANANHHSNSKVNQNDNIFSQSKKNCLSDANLKKLPQSSNSSLINPQLQTQRKFIGLLKINQENQNMQNLEHLKNLKNSSSKKQYKKVFEDSTSAYSSMQKQRPSFTPNSDFSREMQANNIIMNKNKNSLLYPNYSDFSDPINIPNLTSGSGNKSNPNLNSYLAKNQTRSSSSVINNTNNNHIIYENQNDMYESENYGMSNFDEFENYNNKKNMYRDIEGEHIVNKFLNDEITYPSSNNLQY